MLGARRPRACGQVCRHRVSGAEGHLVRRLILASEPTRFLSSVQVGITSIGILNGAIGEASIARPIRAAVDQVPLLAPYAETISLVLMVVLLTVLLVDSR